MTVYVAAYDLERDPEESIPAAQAVTAVHRRHQVPATFFIVARLLEQEPDEYRRILDDDLFDLQCHSYSHRRLRTTDEGERISDEELDTEIGRAIEIVAETFGREVTGFTTPGGFTDGLKGEALVLSKLHEAGIRFVRSDARGPQQTIPAPMTQPYTYAEDGFPDLWELPAQGWHDNVLKGYSRALPYWPPILPWGLPARAPTTPEEEFEVWRPMLDYAACEKLTMVMPTLHPWSIHRFHPEARTLDLIFAHLKSIEMPVVTCRQLHEQLAASR